MLPKFELYMPDTMEEACRLKAEGAEVVAGGTDVFVNMHGGKDRSGKVVDIKNIPTLQGHTFDEAQGLDLGALTTHREIELWDVIKKHYRAMFEGCSRVGSVQIRTRGTLGGNICNGAPSADSIGPMLVHDARVVAAGPAGEREVPLHAFYLGLKKLDLGPDELLCHPYAGAACPLRQLLHQVHPPGRHGPGAAGRLRLCGAGGRHPEDCADRPDHRRAHAHPGL